jgi:hypothetical protein
MLAAGTGISDHPDGRQLWCDISVFDGLDIDRPMIQMDSSDQQQIKWDRKGCRLTGTSGKETITKIHHRNGRDGLTG